LTLFYTALVRFGSYYRIFVHMQIVLRSVSSASGYVTW